ncbi:hypothetical protein FCM35_KLT09770 [Carex littledalei]|uniref:Uncharacterized protein n=1 Tax=Carex littledalei TaxID=544730 RepID=A0A833RS79_9POAL|nr:hypothetical protein FCM35_KLT09770 [Carex littledalei]
MEGCVHWLSDTWDLADQVDPVDQVHPEVLDQDGHLSLEARQGHLLPVDPFGALAFSVHASTSFVAAACYRSVVGPFSEDHLPVHRGPRAHHFNLYVLYSNVLK